jgi:hypothetical protein
MLKILIACAFLAIIVDTLNAKPEDRSHAWVEGFAILVAVAVVSLVGAWSDYKKEGQFLKQQQLEENSKVVRSSFGRFFLIQRLKSDARERRSKSTATTSASATSSRSRTA